MVTVPESTHFTIEFTVPKFSGLRNNKRVLDSERVAVWKAEWYLSVETSKGREVDGEKTKGVGVHLHMNLLYSVSRRKVQRLSSGLQALVRTKTHTHTHSTVSTQLEPTTISVYSKRIGYRQGEGPSRKYLPAES